MDKGVKRIIPQFAIPPELEPCCDRLDNKTREHKVIEKVKLINNELHSNKSWAVVYETRHFDLWKRVL